MPAGPVTEGVDLVSSFFAVPGQCFRHNLLVVLNMDQFQSPRGSDRIGFRRFAVALPGFTDYKTIDRQTFGTERVSLSFSSQRHYSERWRSALAMDQHDDTSKPEQGQFDKTRWSMVFEAMQSPAPGASQALANLCECYWRPLYAFARRRGRSPEDAQDLVQGFFEHLIGSRGLATVDRSKGRFRSFLLASFQNFIAAETRLARAEKRGGRVELIRLDWQDAEARLVFEPEDRLTPETLYDAQWALLLLRSATERLQQEQTAMGKSETFQTLRGFLGGDGCGRVPVSYEEAARALGVGVPNVTNLIHRLRQRHGQLVREEVERTVLDPTEVEPELHGLCEALVQAEGRVRA
jgi:RNA polymerase sigma factor (sigma-70 family)